MATTITRDQMIAKFEEIDSTYSVFYSAVYPDMILERKEGTARTDAALTTLATALVKEKSTLFGKKYGNVGKACSFCVRSGGAAQVEMC